MRVKTAKKIVHVVLFMTMICCSSEATLSTSQNGAAPKAIETEAQIFAWYDAIVKNFQSGDIKSIISALAPEYIQREIASDGRTKEGRDEVVKRWKSEPAKRGISANGPGRVLVSSLIVSGEKATVEGFWSGTWRAFPDPTDHPEAGMSWDCSFVSEWKKTPKGWLQVKMTNTFVADGYTLSMKIKPAHDALKAKYAKG